MTESSDARWQRHVQPGATQDTPRNKLGATTPEDLRSLEEPLVAARAATLRDEGIPHTFDLDGLKEIHGHLFQDVYETAGQLRDVGLEKEGRAFRHPSTIEQDMGQISGYLAQTDNLTGFQGQQYADRLTDVYVAVNDAHPFREGNGRTQREFVAALARESSQDLDTSALKGSIADAQMRSALDGDKAGLYARMGANLRPMQQDVASTSSPDRASPAQGQTTRPEGPVQASFPGPASQAVEAPKPRAPQTPGTQRGRGPSGPELGR